MSFIIHPELYLSSSTSIETQTAPGWTENVCWIKFYLSKKMAETWLTFFMASFSCPTRFTITVIWCGSSITCGIYTTRIAQTFIIVWPKWCTLNIDKPFPRIRAPFIINDPWFKCIQVTYGQNSLHCKCFAYGNYRFCLCSKSSLSLSVF